MDYSNLLLGGLIVIAVVSLVAAAILTIDLTLEPLTKE